MSEVWIKERHGNDEVLVRYVRGAEQVASEPKGKIPAWRYILASLIGGATAILCFAASIPMLFLGIIPGILCWIGGAMLTLMITKAIMGKPQPVSGVVEAPKFSAAIPEGIADDYRQPNAY